MDASIPSFLGLDTVVHWLTGLVGAFGGLVLHDVRERAIRAEDAAEQNAKAIAQNASDISHLYGRLDVNLPPRRD